MPLTTRHALAIAIAAAVLLGGGVVALRAHAATFSPAGNACLENETTIDDCDGNDAPDGVSSIVRTYSVPEGDSMPGRMVFFTPPQWSFANAQDVPDGRPVGVLNAGMTIGLLNGPCSTHLPVQFNLQDATVDTSDTVLFNEPHKPANEVSEQFQVVNGIARGVTAYPDYLLRILHDGNGNALQPRARYYGQALVGGMMQSVNIVTFDPGVVLRGDSIDPSYGFVTVPVFNNEGDVDAKHFPKAITDVCSPFEMALTLSGASGPSTVLRNPPDDGTFSFVTYTSSLPDADDDGIENRLDPCPYNPNANWNPRDDSFEGDIDRDGIPDVCDPLPENPGNPGDGAINDHDGDNYYNRDDNCPIDRNNAASPYYFGYMGPDTQGDDDQDGIGNVCDLSPNEWDGVDITRCIVADVVIGDGGLPAYFDSPPCGAGPFQTPTPTPVSDFITPTPGALPEAGGPASHPNPWTPWLIFAALALTASVGAALAAAYRRF